MSSKRKLIEEETSKVEGEEKEKKLSQEENSLKNSGKFVQFIILARDV